MRPLGFDISEKAVRRAGLDYWPMVDLRVYDESGRSFFAAASRSGADLWLATTKAPQDYSAARFPPDSWLFFGKETAGLPLDFPGAVPGPMHPHSHACQDASSLNLANSVASSHL